MLEEEIAGDVVRRVVASRRVWCIVRDRGSDVLHHEVASGVANPERLALGVECRGRHVAIVEKRGVEVVHVHSGAVVGDSDHRPAETVEEGHRGGARVLPALLGSASLLGLRGVSHSWVPSVVLIEGGVELVMGDGVPRGDVDAADRAVGVLRPDMTPDGVVELARCDTIRLGLAIAVF